LLTPDEAAFRREVRAFLEKEVAPHMPKYVENAQVPYELLLKIG